MDFKDIYLYQPGLQFPNCVGGINMKKALALLLALVVLLTLCACGSDDSSQAEVELPKNGKKGPSQDLIPQDLESALFQLPNAEVTEVTTVKSLTEDSHYEITLQVSAATTYADWQIECDMSYTKYDQGWMLSDIIWNSKTMSFHAFPIWSTWSTMPVQFY